MADATYYARRFKVDAELAQRWIDARPDVCPLCMKSKVPRQLVLDHDHRTGLPRGWLCRLCNGKLGKVKDDAAWMERAIRYLTNPPLS